MLASADDKCEIQGSFTEFRMTQKKSLCNTPKVFVKRVGLNLPIARGDEAGNPEQGALGV